MKKFLTSVLFSIMVDELARDKEKLKKFLLRQAVKHVTEVEKLQAINEKNLTYIDDLTERLYRQNLLIERYKKALKFYANQSTYKPSVVPVKVAGEHIGDFAHGPRAIDADKGRKAYEALGSDES